MEKQYTDTLSIKEWADEDRPREKLLQKGKAALSNVELLAILLRSGTRNDSAVEVSKKILLKTNNDLNELGRLMPKDILDFKIKGIGSTKAITIVAALEIGMRRQRSEIKEKHKITGSSDMHDLLKHDFAELGHEEFWIVLLNRANKVIEKKSISKGGITGTVADVRMIFNYALKAGATSIIIAHNHPSGNLSPSDADRTLTKKIKDAGEILDIKLLDHLIITPKSYYSFADEGSL